MVREEAAEGEVYSELGRRLRGAATVPAHRALATPTCTDEQARRAGSPSRYRQQMDSQKCKVALLGAAGGRSSASATSPQR
jgi:hypothetical protein